MSNNVTKHGIKISAQIIVIMAQWKFNRGWDWGGGLKNVGEMCI